MTFLSRPALLRRAGFALVRTAEPCCPRCRSDDVLTIVYGLVTDPAPFAGEPVSFGGCCVHPGESPTWRCGNCGHEFVVVSLTSA
jgi:hypothetical protein